MRSSRVGRVGLVSAIGAAVVFSIVYQGFPSIVVRTGVALERRSAGFAARTIGTSSGLVPYLEGGSGPAVVLLHGFQDDGNSWIAVGRRLTGQYRVVIPDLHGFGANRAATDGDYRPPAQARRVHAFVEALGLEAVHVAGISMGGEIAASYAAQFPAATLSLGLFSTAGARPDTATPLALRVAAGDNIFHVTDAATLDTLIRLIGAGDPGLRLPAPLKRTMVEEYLHRNGQWDSVFRQLIEPPMLYLVDSLAPGIRAPTLVLWGADDPLLAVSGGRRLTARLPHGVFTLLPDCGHLCPVTQPKELADRYRGFLSTIRRGEPPR